MAAIASQYSVMLAAQASAVIPTVCPSRLGERSTASPSRKRRDQPAGLASQ